MPVTHATLRAGLKTRLETISGLRVHAYPPDNVNELPCAIIQPNEASYPVAMGGICGIDALFDVLVIHSLSAGVDNAQPILDAFLDPEGSSSIIAAVYGDPTLGGVARTCIVESYADYGGFEYGQTVVAGARVTVRVLAKT